MPIFLILALLIAIVAVIFAVQNVTLVTIAFFTFQIHTSLAVAVLVALGAGILITLLVSVPGRIRGRMNRTNQNKKMTALEAERNQLQQRVNEVSVDRDKYVKQLGDSQKEIAKLEEQLASISAALQEKDEQAAKGPSISTPAISGDTQPTNPPPAEPGNP